MKKSIVPLLLIFILIIPAVHPAYNDTTLEAPRLNKVLVFQGELTVDDFSGNITISVKALNIISDSGRISVNYTYNYTIIGNLNGTEYQISDSNTVISEGGMGAFIYISPVSKSITLPLAIAPQFAPVYLSIYQNLRIEFSSGLSSSEILIMNTDITERNGGHAISIDYREYRYSGRYNESFLFSIPYSFIVHYEQSTSDKHIDISIKSYEGVEPLEGSKIDIPFKKATRSVGGGYYYDSERIGYTSGSVTVTVEEAYKYGESYRFFAYIYGDMEDRYVYEDHNETYYYHLDGRGVFGYSNSTPVTLVGYVSFMIDVNSIDKVAEMFDFNINVSDAEISVSGKTYKGYLLEVTSDDLNGTALVLDNGLAANINASAILGEGLIYTHNITLTQYEGPEGASGGISGVLLIAIIIIVIAVVLVILLIRRRRRFLNYF